MLELASYTISIQALRFGDFLASALVRDPAYANIT